jgi:hypothetical protein
MLVTARAIVATDMSTLRHVRFVMKGGVVYRNTPFSGPGGLQFRQDDGIVVVVVAPLPLRML